MKPFVKNGPKGYISINEAVFHAAALSPQTREMRFDRAAFFSLALQIRQEDEGAGQNPRVRRD